MNILGINQVTGLLSGMHDSAAALVMDGKLVATMEEERFNRQRHHKGTPHKAIDYCLKEGGITIKDIDVIAVSYNPWGFLKNGFFFLSPWAMFSYVANIFVFSRGVGMLAKKAGGARIMYIDHHLAHAASSYRCAPFKDANVMTIDGAGEHDCAGLFEGRGGKLTRLATLPIAYPTDTRPWRSIGKTYSELTSFLKLGENAEGKTMGLASYGTPRFDFSKILKVESWDRCHVDRRNIRTLYGSYERKLETEPLTQDHKDLAASLQHALEEAFVHLGEDAYKRTGLRTFALAGGVTLNCNSNSRLLLSEFVDAVFIQPAAHDGGVALGAALEAMHRVGDGDFVSFPNAYWGPSYDNDSVEKLLTSAKVSYRKSEHIAADVARLIKDGKIVGWFQGRSEIGPRALGNRSILANPQIPGMNDKINNDVKHREVWRPFAPSLTVESAATYFEGLPKAKESPYMLQTFYVKKAYRSTFPAITHIDGSARIQTVSKEQNPRFHELLTEVGKATGHPMVLNTSFNDKGEPIVCSAFDALRCYFSTGIDALALGDYLLEK
ncbi:MAG TPA: carbamoyltransferase C-terminal domain-containing protein [Candidatus Paceibacterota bacterium]|nr:carbamoyltransferase C-terminal domain-containing protein [Candidatus Paceibacterota bacterium]